MYQELYYHIMNNMNYTSTMSFSIGDNFYIDEVRCFWISAVNTESDYVRKEPFRKRGPYMENVYADVDEEEEEYGDRTDYR